MFNFKGKYSVLCRKVALCTTKNINTSNAIKMNTEKEVLQILKNHTWDFYFEGYRFKPFFFPVLPKDNIICSQGSKYVSLWTLYDFLIRGISVLFSKFCVLVLLPLFILDIYARRSLWMLCFYPYYTQIVLVSPTLQV